ncbi:MAG: GNAT family N-acetyltransferase [Candidatus Eremiobacteraeota bacterium]|nr:GNAT family N-acetyltransferase [Candidatus Eremiobacteraeota bacterium]
MWQFLQGVAPDGFIAAREDAELVGYAIFVPSLKKMQRRAILSGAVLRWSWSTFWRRELRWGAIGRIVRNKILFISGGQRFRSKGDAQLLNIAVAPEAQGRGIAQLLVTRGLAQMRALSVSEVRLEVRPWNAAAIALYRRAGWHEAGRTRDLEGAWIVMVTNP